MEKKTKNLFKALFMTCTLALTVGLVATLSIGSEKEKTYLCEADRLLDGFTAQETENAYPNGTTVNEVVYPSYSTGLEYSTKQSAGEEGTKAKPYKASVARGSCTDTAVVLPEYYYDGSHYYKVVGIDQDGFNAQKPAKNENGSDIGCYDLTSISSLKEFTLVGSQAFAYTSLTTVEFSKNLTELSPSMFFHCKQLETTEFVQLDGEATSSTGTYAAFSSVGNNCFTDCVNYTGMILPRTLTNIGEGAYQNCTSLTSIFLPATDVVGQHLEIGDYAYAGCTKVTIVYISSKVEKIGAHAFEGCINAKGYSALTYSALLAQLEEGGDGDWNYLFNDGTYDSTGTYDTFLDFTGRDGKGDLLYDQPYFYSLNQDGITCTLDVYDGSVSDDPSKTYLYNVDRVIPETRGAGYPVTRIGQELFKNNTDMTSLVIPDSVKEIGIAAFAGCSNLENVSLGSGLKTIENYAFAPWNGVGEETQSNNLTSLEIPASVEWIGEYAFPYMYKMMNITFLGSSDDTSNLYYIGKHAFDKAGFDYKDKCYTGGSFTEVRNPLVLNMHPKDPSIALDWNPNSGSSNRRPKTAQESFTEICEYAFYGNQWIGAIRITSDRLIIDGYVFADCYWLVEADLGQGLKTIGNTKNSQVSGYNTGFTFGINKTGSSTTTNDLGGPLEENSDAEIKPYVPMSTLYIEPELEGGRYVGKGTLEGRYQTMIYTSVLNNTNNRYFFQWGLAEGSYSDIQAPYIDRGVPATSNGTELNAANPAKFSNDESFDNSYKGYYGVDLALGSSYIQDTYTAAASYYKIRQGGYYGVNFAHATVDQVVNGNNITYTTTYKDSSGNTISSIDSNIRYGFTLYDSTTGRAKFDFVQTEKDSNNLIMTKFHYNPYWEQSKNVTVPQTVTFGGRTFTVTEIGNCAFFRNICPQTHAWVKETVSTNVHSMRYVSPQGDTSSTNPNQDSNGEYYAEHNDDFYNLESVTLPDTITRIGGNAFYMCTALQSLKTTGNATEGRFPSGLQKIQQYAFCFTGLTSVSLPNTLQLLGNQHGLCNPFTGCMALQTISVDAGGSYFGSSNNYLTNASGTTIYQAPLKSINGSIEIPAGTTTLENSAFRGARKITNIVIPTSLTTIGPACFDAISYGEVVYTNDDRDKIMPEKTRKGIFDRSNSVLDKITVKDGARSGLTTIGALAFYGCTAFDGIDFPNDLQTIGDRAFYNCSGANMYYFPNSLTSIGVEAFRANSAFKQIKTDAKPNGEVQGYINLAATRLNFLGRNAFNTGKTYFNTISLPSTLTKINDGVIFVDKYSGLTTVYIHNNTTEMNAGVFKENSSLATFKTWTGSVDANGDIPSPQMSTNNALPTNLTKIGGYCFYNCRGLPDFGTYPSTLTKIGSNAFQGCTNANFTSVDLSGSSADLQIESNAFSGCTNVTSVSLVSSAGSRDKTGGSLTILGNAFASCTSLTEIIIPRGSIVYAGAFSNSTSLSKIYVCDTYAGANVAYSYKNGNNTINTVRIPTTIKSSTSAEILYYADSPSDVPNPEIPGTKYWHYVGNSPTEWTPS